MALQITIFPILLKVNWIRWAVICGVKNEDESEREIDEEEKGDDFWGLQSGTNEEDDGVIWL